MQVLSHQVTEPRQWITLLATALLLVVSALSPAVNAADKNKSRDIRDLFFGEALYQAEQKKLVQDAIGSSKESHMTDESNG